MTSEEVTALAVFIKDFDPRYETSRALYAGTPCVRALPTDGEAVTYYSIAYYADEARQKVHLADFQAALDRWVSEQQGRE